ncbi:hypothetical protein MACH26_24520 [Planctobacterium marinum]|uniref:Uncharacterized protein n=2 Tax=Planctobacterium marinum TaxID=1631968 RepID=A0AA48KPR7_9ALTE|nr:hypothetical protein MACH26_24520 [Planctobacterium marinum]
MTPEGEMMIACKTEYSGSPNVDKYAVEYILSHCAKQAVQNGNTVVDKKLLNLALTVPEPPEGQKWSFELATALHKKGSLSDKQYGYLIAYIDLGHNKD